MTVAICIGAKRHIVVSYTDIIRLTPKLFMEGTLIDAYSKSFVRESTQREGGPLKAYVFSSQFSAKVLLPEGQKEVVKWTNDLVSSWLCTCARARVYKVV